MTVTQGGATAATGLSPREVEIVDMLAMGRSIEGIAATLGLSPSTVSTHIRQKAMPELEYQSWARTL